MSGLSNYSPQHHFKRSIEVYQGKEARISHEDMDRMRKKIEEVWPQDLLNLTPDIIRRHMRELQLNYNADYISYQITGKKLPLSDEDFEMLKRSFDEL